MKFKIYQIDGTLDAKHYKFNSSGVLPRKDGFPVADPAIYKQVYDGNLKVNCLESIFVAFNFDTRPQDFRGHSLSVSDVIAVEEGGDIAPGYYYCDIFGFTQVEF